MRPRRLALLPVVALAVTVGSAGAGAARAASPAPSASTSATICVALVVDGRALGSDVSTTCAKVAKGATGVDVLQAAGHTIGYRHDGLICTIDGLPNSGCAGVDDTHYWAYFHRAPGATTWTYSTEGPATYQPKNASTEGWVYDDGTSNAPENVPYDQICKPTATASPTPTHTATHKPQPVTTPTTRHRHRPALPPPTPSAGVSAPATATSTPSHHPRHHRRLRGPAHRATPTAPVGTSPPTPEPSTTSAALVGGVPPTHHGRGMAGLVTGIVVVLGLAALAVSRFRRAPR